LPGSLAPRRRAVLTRPARVTEPGLLAGLARRTSRLRSGLRSSNRNPLGNCVGARVETPRGPDSARARFLIAPRRSVHFFVDLPDRTRLRPEELVRYACHHRFRGLEGKPAPAAVNLSPVARDYPSRALGNHFRSTALRLFYQGTWETVHAGCGK
jgi:hypothetical protein